MSPRRMAVVPQLLARAAAPVEAVLRPVEGDQPAAQRLAQAHRRMHAAGIEAGRVRQQAHAPPAQERTARPEQDLEA
jgi:hypothetical protein